MVRGVGRSRMVAMAAVLAGSVVGVSGLAFACTPGGEVYINPPSGLAGSQPTLSGNNWGAHEARLEIRWNSMSGPVLAEVTPVGGSFSVAVTIPQATPGVYYIVTKSPTRATPARLAFEVTAPRTTSGATETPERQTSANANAGETAASSGSGQTAASTSGADANGGSSAPAPGRFGPMAGSARPAPGADAARASAAAPAATAAGKTKTPAASPAAPAAAPSDPALPADPRPSERTATGDLASGLEAGPSLLPGLNDRPTTTAPGSPLALGAGLLAAGLGTLFAGFAAAELRRRRSPAG